MNHQDRQHFEDLIVKAIQATKQENSGLISELKSSVEKIVKEQVEHKQLITNYIEEDTKDKQEIKKKLSVTTEWQTNATPAIDILKKLMSFGAVGGWILQSLILLGSGIGVVYALVKWLRN